MHSRLKSCATSSARGCSGTLHCTVKTATVCQSSKDAATTVIDRRSLLLGTSTAALITTGKAVAATNTKVQNAGDWSSPGLAAPEDDALPKFFTTASGVKVQELSGGNGEAVKPGDAVLIDFVLRRNNGYFIYGELDSLAIKSP